MQPCEHTDFEEWSVCILSVNNLIYWAGGEGRELLVKGSCLNQYWGKTESRDLFDTVTTTVLMRFLHVSNSEKSLLWYVAITCHFGTSVSQVMATSRGRSWKTSSGSWKRPGEEQGWWVQGSEIKHRCTHCPLDHFIEFNCFLGPFKPPIQRKNEGVHAEVRQEQRWTDWDVRGKAFKVLLVLLLKICDSH